MRTNILLVLLLQVFVIFLNETLYSIRFIYLDVAKFNNIYLKHFLLFHITDATNYIFLKKSFIEHPIHTSVLKANNRGFKLPLITRI